MVQEQLNDYIASQIKLAVSRDAIKSALVGAGWADADVEDTLKKIEAANKPTAPAAPAVSPRPASSPVNSPSSSMNMGGIARGNDVKSIKVSDLVSASGSAVSFSGSPAASQNKNIVQKSQPVNLKSPSVDTSGAMKPQKGGGKMGLIVKIVVILVILGLGGAAGYLYMQNSTLAGKVGELNTASSNVASTAASLNAQVQLLNASNTALGAEVAAMTADEALLKANLSFAAVPPASSGAPSSETVSINGTLTSKASSFTLTSPYGVLVFVTNAKDPKIIAALKPLLASTSSVMLTGTHVPGSQNITVTEVNGVAL